MANLTTLAAAQGLNDQTALLTAITGVVVGALLLIDGEVEKVLGPIPAAATTPVNVLRGQESSFNQAHGLAAQVRIGVGPTALAAGDFGAAAPGTLGSPMPPSKYIERRGYVAAGAITLPSIGNDMVAILYGTAALAMTLANPSILTEGSRLMIEGTGKAAHTVTYAAGLGNVGAAADVITFKADQSQAIELVASGGFWVNESLVAGAATVAGAGLA